VLDNIFCYLGTLTILELFEMLKYVVGLRLLVIHLYLFASFSDIRFLPVNEFHVTKKSERPGHHF